MVCHLGALRGEDISVTRLGRFAAILSLHISPVGSVVLCMGRGSVHNLGCNLPFQALGARRLPVMG